MEFDPDKQVVRVKVFYEDEVRDDEWSGLPREGVQIVKLYYTDGTSRVIQGFDFYFKAQGTNDDIYGSTNNEADIERYTNVVALRGRWLDDATFAAVERRAMQDNG